MKIWTDYRAFGSTGHQGEYHCHPFYEMTLLLSGNIRVYNGVYNVALAAPCLLIEKPYVYHTVEAATGTDYERYNLYTQFSNASKLAASMDTHDLFLCDLTVIKLTKEQIESLVCYIKKIEKFEKNQTLCRRLMEVFAEEASHYAGRGNTVRHNTGDMYIREVLKYIEDNLGEVLTLTDIAREHNVCVTKLCCDFKKITMTTVAKYVQSMRVNRAGFLLSKGQSVLKTALDCGFLNESHFIAVFKKATGQTPGAYMRDRKKTPKN